MKDTRGRWKTAISAGANGRGLRRQRYRYRLGTLTHRLARDELFRKLTYGSVAWVWR